MVDRSTDGAGGNTTKRGDIMTRGWITPALSLDAASVGLASSMLGSSAMNGRRVQRVRVCLISVRACGRSKQRRLRPCGFLKKSDDFEVESACLHPGLTGNEDQRNLSVIDFVLSEERLARHENLQIFSSGAPHK
jgi:hypothetical protein